MQAHFPYIAPLSVYPGEYIPLFEMYEFEQKIKSLPENNEVVLPANIEESAYCYTIEIPAPGVSRENFFIKVDDNMLSVSIIQDECRLAQQKNIQSHEYDVGFYSRKIVLADNADAAFISAEYRSGILHLYVPKSEHPLKRVRTKIAVL